jgi:hypothetical protein
VKPSPRGLVTPKAEDTLKSQGTGAILLARDPPHDLEPQAQGLAGSVEDRTRCDRGLVAAFPAVQETPLGEPGLGGTASRAPEAARPTKLQQIPPTLLLGGKPAIELRQGPRILSLEHEGILHLEVTGGKWISLCAQYTASRARVQGISSAGAAPASRLSPPRVTA